MGHALRNYDLLYDKNKLAANINIESQAPKENLRLELAVSRLRQKISHDLIFECEGYHQS